MAATTSITFPPKSHTHSEYALSAHTHTNYAALTHTHNEYAISSHTHDGYALSDHGHEPGFTNSEIDIWDHQGLINAIAVNDNYWFSNCHFFRTACQGKMGTGNFVTTIRNATGNTLKVLPPWETGLAWGGADTEGFLTVGESVGYICRGSDNEKIAMTVHQLAFLEQIYPVGAIYLSTNATNPADLFHIGTWGLVAQNRMLLGCDSGEAGKEGGSMTKNVPLLAHTHTGPSHEHKITVGVSSKTVTTTSDATHNHYYDISGATNNSSHSYELSIPRDKRAASGTAILIPVASNANGSSLGVATSGGSSDGKHRHNFSVSGYVQESSAVHDHDFGHTHTASSVASGTGATGSTGTANATMDVTNAYYSVYVWRRTA